jgi:hypothetical protein
MAMAATSQTRGLEHPEVASTETDQTELSGTTGPYRSTVRRWSPRGLHPPCSGKRGAPLPSGRWGRAALLWDLLVEPAKHVLRERQPRDLQGFPFD